jgi:HK97 gp10 family phage protein
MSNKFIYKSFIGDVFKDIKTIEKEALKAASKHVQKKMKEKVKAIGIGKRTGNLLKGIKYDIRDSDSAFVGVGPPAYHAHLIEFGTLDRWTKKGTYKGKVTKKPFIIPTLEEESEAVRNIMAGGFSKL